MSDDIEIEFSIKMPVLLQTPAEFAHCWNGHEHRFSTARCTCDLAFWVGRRCVACCGSAAQQCPTAACVYIFYLSMSHGNIRRIQFVLLTILWSFLYIRHCLWTLLQSRELLHALQLCACLPCEGQEIIKHLARTRLNIKTLFAYKNAIVIHTLNVALRVVEQAIN